MAISWIDYSNGDTLSAIRTAENAFNNAVVTDVNANTTQVTTNVTNITTNTTDISNIETGTTAFTKVKMTPQVTAPTHVEGQMFYDSISETMRIQGPFTGTSVAVGHGMHIHVENNSGALIEKGMAVRQSGVVAGKVQIVKALADTFLHARMFGVVSADIADGAEGAISTFGEITDLNTSTLPTGVPLYLSDTVAGTYTSTAPDIISRVGGALTADASGVLFVSIINNKNTPTVFGGMQGQSGTGIYSLTTTAQDIVDYDTESSVVVGTNITTGELTLPNDGGYRMHFTGIISFTSTTSTRTVYVELYDVTNTVIHISSPVNIPRNATEDTLGFSWAIEEVTGNIHKMRLRSVPDMSITLDNVSFDIQSVSIV